MPDIDYVSSKPLPENLSDIADSLRSKTGISGEIHTDEMAGIVDTLGSPLPPLTNPATAADILDGKEAIVLDANDEPVKVTGTYKVVYTPLEVTTMTLSSLFEGKSGFQSNRITLNIPLVTTAASVFRNATFLPNTEVYLDITNGVSVYWFFRDSSNLKKVTMVCDFKTKAVNLQYFFYGCASLEEIYCDFDFSQNVLSNTNAIIRVFDGCENLTRLRFVPNSIYDLNSSTFGRCSALSDDSIVSIANGLMDNRTGQTLTLHATPKARTLEIMGTVSQVTEEGATYNFFTADEQGTTSLNSFITQTKGWTLA